MPDNWKQRKVLPKLRDTLGPPGWYSRGYLPHFDGGEIPQTVTFCLFDSLPRSLLEQWRIELSHLVEKEAQLERRKRIEVYLDRGEGSAFMNNPRVADEVQNALLFFDSSRYRLQAWVVMPNHVRVVDPCGWLGTR